MKTEFKPELELDQMQQADLVAIMGQAGYKVIHLIARSEVDRFFLALANIPESATDAERLEKLRVARTAAMLYEGITNRINHEFQKYTGSRKDIGEPIDITEGLIDIGPAASTLQDLFPAEETDANDY